MRVLINENHKMGYSANGELRIFESRGGKVIWYSDKDLNECNLIDNVMEVVGIDQKAKFMDIELRKNREGNTCMKMSLILIISTTG